MVTVYATAGFDLGARLAELSRSNPAVRLAYCQSALECAVFGGGSAEEIDAAAGDYLLALPEPPAEETTIEVEGDGAEPEQTYPLIDVSACGYCGSTRGSDPDYGWCIDCKGV